MVNGTGKSLKEKGLHTQRAFLLYLLYLSSSSFYSARSIYYTSTASGFYLFFGSGSACGKAINSAENRVLLPRNQMPNHKHQRMTVDPA
jgi:hypothetical protein